MPTHALSTNNYGTFKFIVDTNPANGTHVTLASAMADAVSGETIFLRSSVTENVTLTPGVNIVGPGGEISSNQPTIIGTLTMTGAGTCLIQNVALQTNSNFLIAVTGSAASILNVSNCYLNCSNNTGISYTSSNSSSSIAINNCNGDLGTTGIGLFSHSSTGNLDIYRTIITNTGSSLTASTVSAGGLTILYSAFNISITTSGNSQITFSYNLFDVTTFNIIPLTVGGSGINRVNGDIYISDTASSISISTTLIVSNITVNSSNTNVLTGAGTLNQSNIVFDGTSTGSNVTTNTFAPNGKTGSWTPIIKFGGGTTGITYAVQTGFYSVVGSLVFINMNITLTNKGSSTGSATIEGLPVSTGTNGGLNVIPASFWAQLTLTATYTSVGGYFGANSTIFNLGQSTPVAGAITNLTNTMFANTSSLSIAGCYMIN